MTEPKTIVFGSAPAVGSPAPRVGPTALSFPTPPLAQQPAPVTARGPQPLSFANQPVTNVPQSAKRESAPVGVHEHALRKLRESNETLYQQQQLRVVRQLQQLLPLKLDTVLDWGCKTMQRLADDAREATTLMQTISTANASGTIQLVMDTLSSSATSVLDRIKRKVVNPLSWEPTLRMLQTQFAPWIRDCEQRIVSAEQQLADVTVKAATLAAVADSIDVIVDDDIDRAVNMRRITLAQGVRQAQLTIEQLKQTRRLLIDQRLQVDQVLTTALPAWKAANGR